MRNLLITGHREGNHDAVLAPFVSQSLSFLSTASVCRRPRNHFRTSDSETQHVCLDLNSQPSFTDCPTDRSGLAQAPTRPLVGSFQLAWFLTACPQLATPGYFNSYQEERASVCPVKDMQTPRVSWKPGCISLQGSRPFFHATSKKPA